jgi:hypothetical protein
VDLAAEAATQPLYSVERYVEFDTQSLHVADPDGSPPVHVEADLSTLQLFNQGDNEKGRIRHDAGKLGLP